MGNKDIIFHGQFLATLFPHVTLICVASGSDLYRPYGPLDMTNAEIQ